MRPLVFQRTTVRKLRTGGLQSARVVGVDIGPNVPTLPWDTVVGLPSDLRAPMRTSVDTTAFERLQLPRDPVGTQLDVRGQRVTVAVVTHAIRSSSTLPYLFTTPESARRMSGMPADSTNVWLVDLQNPACAASVAGSISAVPGLQAMSRAAFKARTERYWLTSTGVGASLTYVAIMALVVGTMIVGQTLYSLAGDHARELATLRALGRRRRELFGFVGWQAALLAVTGIGLGYAISAAVRVLSRGTKLTIVLPPEAALLGIGALLAMCLFASLLGARRVMTLDPAMVFA